MEKISVIMPTYNAERFIKKSINSVLAQTYSNFELLIVNDGSTDSTEEIILKFMKSEKRIKYFKINNSGSAVARNLGLDNATGKYLFFLDSDDYIDKKTFEILHSKIIKYECDIVSCSFKKIYSNKTIEEFTNMKEGYYNKHRLEKEFYPYLISKSASKSNKIIPKQMWTKIYNMELIKKHNIRFIPELRMGQDMVFSYQALLHAESFYYLPNDKLYNYVYNKSSRTHTYLNDAWKILKETANQSEKLSIEFPNYRLKKQVPYALVNSALSAIANVSLYPKCFNKKNKFNEINEIINDCDLQHALKKIELKNLGFIRGTLAFMIKKELVYPILALTFFYRRK